MSLKRRPQFIDLNSEKEKIFLAQRIVRVKGSGLWDPFVDKEESARQGRIALVFIILFGLLSMAFL